MNMTRYLREAAKAWAKATLNVQRFADAYADAVDAFGDDARKEFQAAYPMFGDREWFRLGKIADGELLPQFFFKSDSFVSKLLKMKDSMRWQRTLVSASEDGRLVVDRGKGPEKVRLADLTKKEERALRLLMNEDDSGMSPEERILKFREMVAAVNRTQRMERAAWDEKYVDGRMVIHVKRPCRLEASDLRKMLAVLEGDKSHITERPTAEVLKDLASVLVRLSYERDLEWDFCEKHGYYDACWSEDKDEEHNDILDKILALRHEATQLLREGTGDTTLEV